MAVDVTPETPSLVDEYSDAQNQATDITEPTPENHQEDQEIGWKPWRCGDPYRYPMPQNLGESWQACHNLVAKYDKNMCESWRDEVDNLLIFAGLFSAVVTAFAVDSYKWLQEDSADLSVQLLAQISLQLQNIQLANSSFVANPTTSMASPFISNSSNITGSAIRINILWFLSLTLSLSTVLLGILCMQWLREYTRDTGLPHKDAVALRQMRFQGLVDWKVPEILSSLPLLLQVALILFFAGLLDLLWSLHHLVAALVTVVVGLVLLFLAFTTFLPTIQYMYTGNQRLRVSQCAYKSPQAWAFHRLVLFISLNISRHERIRTLFPRLVRYYYAVADASWADYDLRWKKLRDVAPISEAFPERHEGSDIVAGLSWINQSYRKTADAVYVLYHCLQDLPVAFAANFVAECYPDAIPHLREALNHTMRFSSTSEKKEFISVLFLEKHRKIHRTFSSYHLEQVIRLVNSGDCVPFTQWPLTLPASGIPDEIIYQFLMSLKLLMSRERIPSENIFSIWMLIKYAALQEKKSEDYTRMALSIIAEFEKWLLRPSTDIRRVKLCGSSVLMVFNDGGEPSLAWKKLMRVGGWQVQSLFRTMDTRITEMGGAEEVLGRTTSKQWDTLISNSSRASPEGRV